MNRVLYFSCTNQSEKIAMHFANALQYPFHDLTSYRGRNNFDYENAYEIVVLCFPVHSQNIPEAVTFILRNLKAKYIMLIATYGKMGIGNVLLDAQKLTPSQVIGGALIPTQHSYKDNGSFMDYNLLEPLIMKLKNKNYTEIQLIKNKKNIFANFIPLKRSQWSVKITKKESCISCQICRDVCPMGAIDKGVIDNNCIRCLRCVMQCPEKALAVKITLPLKKYLKKDKVKDLKIFI